MCQVAPEISHFLQEVSQHDIHRCVFTGVDHWPHAAKVGDEIDLYLYEPLLNRFLRVHAKITLTNHPHPEQYELFGIATITNVYQTMFPGTYHYICQPSSTSETKYRITINMSSRHVSNSSVVLMPTYDSPA